MCLDKRKYLFRCSDCEMIVSIELEEEEDLEKLHKDEFILDCPCGGMSSQLLD